jgi:hypothetical protein
MEEDHANTEKGRFERNRRDHEKVITMTTWKMTGRERRREAITPRHEPSNCTKGVDEC